MEVKEKFEAFSLRKKRSVRPKISAPRAQISAPVATSLPAAAERSTNVPIDQSYRKGSENTAAENTADYVKRRYSTKVHQIPRESWDAPSVPAIPGQYANGHGDGNSIGNGNSISNGNESQVSPVSPSASSIPESHRQRDRRKSSGPREKITVDLKALQNPDLRAEQCV